MSNSKTFRLFISSTFSDFSAERKVLHEKVFPKIDKHCSEAGYTFQPIDLRWGVSVEAQLDQKTLELCLSEVRACKHYAHPNFLIMLGNRYGGVGLPYAIEAIEFGKIHTYHEKDTEAVTLLNEWYHEDSNHRLNDSHAYVLKPRDPDDAWATIETQLQTLLQSAAEALFKDKNDPAYRKYFMSYTEAEVEEGIFSYAGLTAYQLEQSKDNPTAAKLDTKYIYGWLRDLDNLENLDPTKEPDKLYRDIDQTNSNAFRDNLKAVLEPLDNLGTGTTTLSDDPKAPIQDQDYLDAFEIFITEKLKAAVEEQINKDKIVPLDQKQNQKTNQALEQERSEQLRFKALKTDIFEGRIIELQRIQDYINNQANHQPLMVHGISGIGKSAFMAKAIDQTEERLDSIVFYRFIGVTPSSANLRSLLELLMEDLAEEGVITLPEEGFEQENNQFNQQVKALLSSITEPTVLFLDALDQLRHNDYLMWLPMELPENLKIILSTLDQEGYTHYYDLLKNKLDQNNNQLKIRPLDKDSGVKTLETLLKKEHRTLRKEQFDYVMGQYIASDSSPLYLRLAFEEAKTWKSSDLVKGEAEAEEGDKEDLAIGIHPIIHEFIDNLTEKYHHPKEVVHKVLGLIKASHDGLSEKEILDLLSRNSDIMKIVSNEYWGVAKSGKEERFPMSIWARLHEQLNPFLNERDVDGQQLITFFHRQIDEAVGLYSYENNKEVLHVELAAYFDSIIPMQNGDLSKNSRKFKELIHANVLLGEDNKIDNILNTLNTYKFYNDFYIWGEEYFSIEDIKEIKIFLDSIISNVAYKFEYVIEREFMLIERLEHEFKKSQYSDIFVTEDFRQQVTYRTSSGSLLRPDVLMSIRDLRNSNMYTIGFEFKQARGDKNKLFQSMVKQTRLYKDVVNGYFFNIVMCKKIFFMKLDSDRSHIFSLMRFMNSCDRHV